MSDPVDFSPAILDLADLEAEAVCAWDPGVRAIIQGAAGDGRGLRANRDAFSIAGLQRSRLRSLTSGTGGWDDSFDQR